MRQPAVPRLWPPEAPVSKGAGQSRTSEHLAEMKRGKLTVMASTRHPQETGSWRPGGLKEGTKLGTNGNRVSARAGGRRVGPARFPGLADALSKPVHRKTDRTPLRTNSFSHEWMFSPFTQYEQCNNKHSAKQQGPTYCTARGTMFSFFQ